MEFDRIKRLNKTRTHDEILKSLRERLNGAHPKMLEIESILVDITEMMHVKTNQYGGNRDEGKSFQYKAWKALFESVERKTARLESLTINSINGDYQAREALLDTYIDLVGGALFSLVNLIDHIQGDL